MARRKMQVDGGLFEIAMAQQDLKGAQMRSCFEQMRGEAVAQRVRVYGFLESGPSSGSFTGMVDRLGSDGPITGVSMPARKQPDTGLSAQPVPVLPEFVKQLWA